MIVINFFYTFASESSTYDLDLDQIIYTITLYFDSKLRQSVRRPPGGPRAMLR